MALVFGPGRASGIEGSSPAQPPSLVVEKHVRYIQSLDTVRQRVQLV